MNIEKDVSPVLVSGTTNLTTANTRAQVITNTSLKPMKGVQFKAGVNNGGSVFVGGANVNSTFTNAGCGLVLEAGDQIFLPLEDPCCLYAFNVTANDILHWIVM